MMYAVAVLATTISKCHACEAAIALASEVTFDNFAHFIRAGAMLPSKILEK